MDAQKSHVEQQVDMEQDQSLKGTMLAVSIVGAVILITWGMLFAIYMFRV